MKLMMDSTKNRRHSFMTEHDEEKKTTDPKLPYVTSATLLTVYQVLLTTPINALLLSSVFPLSHRQFQHRAHSPQAEQRLQ